MAQVVVHVRLRLKWWLRPYLALTRFGLWLGLALDDDRVTEDIKRAVRVEVI